ncbi:MAG: OmpA family protein [Candidatus Dactylopiibacterium sp.]|nr:OmpA family protein [Candidatus Dactylopiibacterium sp.]
MQIRIPLLATSLIALGSLAAPCAQAAPATAWYVAPAVTWAYPADHFHSPANGHGLTLRVGKPLSESWDVQLGTSWSRAHDAQGAVRQNTLGADALYLFSRGTLRPFLLAGAGAGYTRFQTDGDRHAGTSPYVNAGVGLQYQLTESLGLQADYRLVHAYVKPRDFGFSRANTKMLNVGVIWSFGKPAAPAPAPLEAAPAPVTEAPAPAPVAASAPAPAAEPRFETQTLSAQELFGFGSAALQPDQPRLDEIAAALREDAHGVAVNVLGYADRLGSDAYNRKLSQARADAVKAHLVKRGVAEARITALGKGRADPVVSCDQKARAALIKCLEPNRRVVIEPVVVTRRVN